MSPCVRGIVSINASLSGGCLGFGANVGDWSTLL